MSAGSRREAPPPRMPDRAVWINGRIVRDGDATLSLFDRGARDGEGLFESVRVEGGRPRAWRRHLERMVLSAAELGFPVPPSPPVLEAALGEVLAANDLADAAARVTVTRGVAGSRPTRAGCWIEAEPLQGRLWRGTRTGDASAVLSRVPFAPGPLGRHKTTSRIAYHLAREEARAADADEALLVSAAGELLEGAVSNVFVVFGDEVLTPDVAQGILPGITRAQTIEACRVLGIPVRETRIPRALAVAADEMFVTNALQGVVPLARVEGRALRSREVGERIAEAVARSGA